MNVSKGGLKVQTRLSLIPGQKVDVFLRGVTKPYAFCQVVWAHGWGGDRPAEAGLEIMEETPPVRQPADDFLAELRRVYHNPAGSRAPHAVQ